MLNMCLLLHNLLEASLTLQLTFHAPFVSVNASSLALIQMTEREAVHLVLCLGPHNAYHVVTTEQFVVVVVVEGFEIYHAGRAGGGPDQTACVGLVPPTQPA